MRSASTVERWVGGGLEKQRSSCSEHYTRHHVQHAAKKRVPNNNNSSSSRAPTTNAMLLCALPRSLPQSQPRSLPPSQPASRCHQLATRRQTGRSRSRAQYAHKAFSPVACSTACRRATPTRRAAAATTTTTKPLASKMDDADDAQCMRASECARRLPRRECNRDGSMRAALSVTNVPLFCFIVS